MTAHDELRKLAEAAFSSAITSPVILGLVDELSKSKDEIRTRDILYRREIDQLKAKVEELEQYKKDAARYQEFFNAGLPITFMGEDYRTKVELDAAIDAAIATAEGKV